MPKITHCFFFLSHGQKTEENKDPFPGKGEKLFELIRRTQIFIAMTMPVTKKARHDL